MIEQLGAMKFCTSALQYPKYNKSLGGPELELAVAVSDNE